MANENSYYKTSVVPGSKKSDRTYNDIDEEKFRAYAAEKYGEGSDYYEQAMNAYNAYASKTWNPNIWQAGSFNIFGDDSAFQGWQNDRLSIFEDALSRIGDASHQEGYNSAVEQAARLRAAGLNPELTGGVDAGEAGDLDNLEAARAPMNPGNSALQDIANFSQTLLQSTLGVYSSLQGIMGVSADLRAKDLQLTGSLTNEAWKVITDSTGEFINNGFADLSSDTAEVWQDKKTGEARSKLTDAILERIDKLPYGRRNKRKLKQLVWPLIFTEDEDGYNFTVNYETLVHNLLGKNFDARSQYALKSGNLGADTSDEFALRWIGTKVFKPIQELLLETSKTDLDFKKRYNDAALKAGLPELKAGAEGSQYMLEKENKKFRAELNRTFNRIRYNITHSTELSPGWQLSLEAGLLSAQALAFGRLGN